MSQECKTIAGAGYSFISLPTHVPAARKQSQHSIPQQRAGLESTSFCPYLGVLAPASNSMPSFQDRNG